MAIEDAGFLIPIFLNSPLCSAHIANAISSRISAALAVHLLMRPPPPIVFIGVFPIFIIPVPCVFLLPCLTQLYKIVIFFSALLALLLYLVFDVILLSILPSILPGHNLADPFFFTSSNLSISADARKFFSILICLQSFFAIISLYSKSGQVHIHLFIPLDQNIRYVGLFLDDWIPQYPSTW